MTHFIEICADHGIILRQCRCPSPDKAKHIVACPDTDWHVQQVAGLSEPADIRTVINPQI